MSILEIRSPDQEWVTGGVNPRNQQKETKKRKERNGTKGKVKKGTEGKENQGKEKERIGKEKQEHSSMIIRGGLVASW